MKKFERQDRTYGIAVDEDGEYRKIRRMPHGRHVVRKCLKIGSNPETKAFAMLQDMYEKRRSLNRLVWVRQN